MVKETIREIQLKDKKKWEKLYKGYADFYKVEMNDKILQTVWNWLHDKNHEVDGLVYEIDGNIVGLAHYRNAKSIERTRYWFSRRSIRRSKTQRSKNW